MFLSSGSLKIYMSLIFASIIIFGSCTTIQKRIYSNSAILKPDDSKIRVSAESIDRGKTHEVIFRLEKNTDAINISVSATEKPQEFTKNSYPCKTYFIVEKIIDITRFKNNKKRAFSELGRNFNLRWERKNDLTITSQENDPIKTLKKNTDYRIRFSTFRDTACEYTVEIKADCRIFFE